MQPDPTLWPLILPLSIVLIHAGLMPAEHPLRRALSRIDAMDAHHAGLRGPLVDAVWGHAYWALTGALALSGLASFATWIGWLA